MTMSSPREQLRDLLKSNACSGAAPVFDVFSACVAERLGWPVCTLSGSFAKAVNLALPDIGPLANVSDLAGICYRVTSATTVPIIVDADDCGGTPLSALRAIREYEAAGVAGIEVEDNSVPLMGQKVDRHSLLIPKDDYLRDLDAALNARKDENTVIAARTVSLSMLPVEEAADRISAYAQLGVDAIMLAGLSKRGIKDIDVVRSVTDLPIWVTGLPRASGFVFSSNCRFGWPEMRSLTAIVSWRGLPQRILNRRTVRRS